MGRTPTWCLSAGSNAGSGTRFDFNDRYGDAGSPGIWNFGGGVVLSKNIFKVSRS